MQEINASILARGNRKYWYVKYQMFNENIIVKKEESTKVLKTEKTLKFMKSRYLPAWIAKKEEELNQIVHKNLSFSDYAAINLKEKKKLHNFKNIEYYTNRILEEFSSFHIRQITKLQVKQWIFSLIDRRSGKELSKNSKSKYLGVFHSIFELALDDNIIDKNFTYDIKIFGKKRDLNDIKPFSANEVNILLQHSKNLEYGELLYFYLGIAFNQGMSPSEILGLQVGNIDIKNQTITIKRNLTKGKIKETKTIYRDRIIPIFDSTLHYFHSLMSIAIKKRSIWLFSKDNGTHLIDIQAIRGTRGLIKDNKKVKYDTRWYKLLNDLDIDYRDLKNCRHTFAVNAIESKAFTMQEIASLLGHGSLKMLIEHYARWIGDKALEANTKINLYGDTLGDTNNNLNLGCL